MNFKFLKVNTKSEGIFNIFWVNTFQLFKIFFNFLPQSSLDEFLFAHVYLSLRE